MSRDYDLIIVGAGAAGYFSAISAAALNKRVLLLEKTRVPLAKVRISGGGRCNVTHSCFDPKLLSQNYPRGSKELLGAFYRFQPKDTIAWFESKGVILKTEEDGRIFPTTDSSETIIHTLQREAARLNVDLRLGVNIKSVKKEDLFYVEFDNEVVQAKSLLLATGSSSKGHEWAHQWGHTIISPVPSLFTFNIPSSPLLELSGISFEPVILKIEETKQAEQGIILLTHFGFSGPAVLKLSAFAARELHQLNYQATLMVDWSAGQKRGTIQKLLLALKKEKGGQKVSFEDIVKLPKQLEKKLIELLQLTNKRFAELSHQEIEKIIDLLTAQAFQIEGKTTYKQEFVTCGGVKLAEVDFKTMESKLCPGLFFAGEILDIDGVTGGFNFQNAWTTGWLAGQAIGKLSYERD